MSKAIERAHMQMAANRLTIHLLQKGRPAAYKERLIEVLADPDAKNMSTTLAPAAGKTKIGPLGQIVLLVETGVRRISHADSARKTPVAVTIQRGQGTA